jgi:hypothetical protein
VREHLRGYLLEERRKLIYWTRIMSTWLFFVEDREQLYDFLLEALSKLILRTTNIYLPAVCRRKHEDHDVNTEERNNSFVVFKLNILESAEK